jgi:signal peptidase I
VTAALVRGGCWAALLTCCWLGLFVLVPVLALGMGAHVVVGTSMDPLVARGDVVVTGDAPADLAPGAVVTFRTDGAPVTHRVVDVAADGTLTTRGDANPPDATERVDPSDVVGSGRLLVPHVGLPAVWAREGGWAELALTTLAGALLVLGTAVDRPVRTLRHRDQPAPDRPAARAALRPDPVVPGPAGDRPRGHGGAAAPPRQRDGVPAVR